MPPFRIAALATLFLVLAVITLRTAHAAPPEVVTSIKPVQALVKMVMGNLGTPGVVIPPSASPHVFAMKPSQAKMLEDADVIFWIGPALETTLKGPIENVTKSATVVELLKTPGLDLIEYDTLEPAPADEDAHHDEHEHEHGSVDPHVWLSPSNALILVDAIAAQLSQIDPPNAPDYEANAKKARQRIKNLIRQSDRFTQEMHDTPFLVQHDGYAYLVREFNLNQVGHLQIQPGREPGAKHLAALLEQIRTDGAKCLFHESQFSSKLATRLQDEAHIGLNEIDPMGIHLSLSDTTYVRLIQAILLNMEGCLYRRESDTVTDTN